MDCEYIYIENPKESSMKTQNNVHTLYSYAKTKNMKLRSDRVMSNIGNVLPFFHISLYIT